MTKRRKPKPRVLTEKLIAGLKPGDERLRGGQLSDAKTTGLSIRVMPSGVRTWRFKYVSPELTAGGRGRQRSVSLGAYAPGRADSVSLAEARDIAEEYRREIRDGVDPVERQKRERIEAERARADTVEKLADRFVEEYAAKRHKDGGKGARWRLDAQVLPDWRGRPVESITRRDVRELVAAKAKEAPVSANRLLALLSRMFSWAVEQEILEHSPTAGVKPPTKEKSRQRVLTADEIRTFWEATEPRPLDADSDEDDRMTPTMSAFWRLRLVTAQRRVEVSTMRWRDLDLDAGWWTIPPEVSKNGEAHRVPLTGLAMDVLATVPKVGKKPTYVLTGARGTRQQNDSSWAFRRDPDDPERGVEGGVVNFRGHDLRRTAATLMAQAGVGWFEIGRVLNHDPPRGSTGVYVRASYDREKRAALEALERKLRAILAGAEAKGADVVPIRRRRETS